MRAFAAVDPAFIGTKNRIFAGCFSSTGTLKRESNKGRPEGEYESDLAEREKHGTGFKNGGRTTAQLSPNKKADQPDVGGSGTDGCTAPWCKP